MKAGAGDFESSTPRINGGNKGISVLDFVLRIIGFVSTMGSAILMATTNETLPFFTRFVRFRAEYSDLPTFTFFVVANGFVSGYFILSLALSIFHIMRSNAQKTRIVLILLDMTMLVLVTAAASAAAAMVYLAHKGDRKTNWMPICQQFNSFCERISGSLIGSFVGTVALIFLILLSAAALSRRSL